MGREEALSYMRTLQVDLSKISASQFRLLQTAVRYTNSGSLSSIDALLDCPYVIPEPVEDSVGFYELRSLIFF
jgi:hypothetical protein